MRTARSSSHRGGGGSASVHAGVHPPGCGPGDPPGVGLENPPGMGLETPPPQVWAWRHPLPRCGPGVPQARPLYFPLGWGLADR